MQCQTLLSKNLAQSNILFSADTIVQIVVNIGLRHRRERGACFQIGIFTAPHFQLIVHTVDTGCNTFLISIKSRSFITLVKEYFSTYETSFGIGSNIGGRRHASIESSRFARGISAIATIK